MITDTIIKTISGVIYWNDLSAAENHIWIGNCRDWVVMVEFLDNPQLAGVYFTVQYSVPNGYMAAAPGYFAHTWNYPTGIGVANSFVEPARLMCAGENTHPARRLEVNLAAGGLDEILAPQCRFTITVVARP